MFRRYTIVCNCPCLRVFYSLWLSFYANWLSQVFIIPIDDLWLRFELMHVHLLYRWFYLFNMRFFDFFFNVWASYFAYIHIMPTYIWVCVYMKCTNVRILSFCGLSLECYCSGYPVSSGTPSVWHMLYMKIMSYLLGIALVSTIVWVICLSWILYYVPSVLPTNIT